MQGSKSNVLATKSKRNVSNPNPHAGPIRLRKRLPIRLRVTGQSTTNIPIGWSAESISWFPGFFSGDLKCLRFLRCNGASGLCRGSGFGGIRVGPSLASWQS